MQISTNDIIIVTVTICVILLISGCFLLLYIRIYNNRKLLHRQEKLLMVKTFEEELAKSQLEIQENTLKTIASEIHDNVGQLLSLTHFTLSSADISAAPAKEKQKIEDACNLLTNSIKELRHMCSLLHADNVLFDGLAKAIENELGWISKTGRIRVAFNCPSYSTDINDKQKKLIVFRLVQELLNNIIKHANASEITAELQQDDEWLVLTVKDNGIGFNVSEKMQSSVGMGLKSMFKRAELIGGNLNISSEPEKGTIAIVRIRMD